MAKKGTFEDIINIVAKFPWWVGLIGAITIYFVLHHFAIQEVQAPQAMEGLAKTAQLQMIKTLAYLGQYILPLAFILGSLASILSQFKRKRLIEAVQSSSAKDSLLNMSWKEFEMLVGEAFRKQGYSVKETQDGADGGVDLVLSKDGAKTLVQCKQWRSSKVGVSVVRELYGVMAASKVANGIVITSGYFTKEALDFAEGKPIRLIAGEELFKIIKEGKSVASQTVETRAPVDIPVCPLCNSPMMLRTAKKGPKTGSQFWGCSKFPQCRGTRSFDL